jgi:hypothetical protein
VDNRVKPKTAVELQEMIRTYWLDRGYQIVVAVAPKQTDDRLHLAKNAVCSNLKNGLPPGISSKAALTIGRQRVA